MDTTDLEDLLTELAALGDDHSRVEAKRAHGGLPTTIPQTLSAFSNSAGGTLLLGVDEGRSFEATGVADATEMVRRLTAMMADSVDPPVRGQVDVCRVRGADVVVAVVPALARTARPCHVRKEGVHRGSYIRVGDGDRRLSEYEVSLLLAGRGQPREDERPVVEATPSDLSAELVEDFIGRLRSTSRRFQQLPDEVVLRMTKVLVVAPGGSVVPSLTGLLCFASYPQTHFPQLNITLAGYPNVSPGIPGVRGERFTASARFDGPIAEMVAGALVAARREMRTRSVVVGFGRRDVPEYPDLAVREALVNAVVHRDYSASSCGSQVQLEMYPDRLVIRNPGGLFGAVEIDRLGEPGVSSARNGLLMKVLEDVFSPAGEAVVENRGSGIPTMFGALRAAALPPPAFVDQISSFEVTLSNASLIDDATVAWVTMRGVQGLSDSQLIAVARMRNGERLKNASYRRELGVDSRQATTELKELVERGLVEVFGSRGAATYVLSEHRGSPETQQQLDLTGSRETPIAFSGPRGGAEVASDLIYAALASPRSRRELEAMTGFSLRTVLRHLNRLRAAGRIEQTGAVRSPTGRWRRTDRRNDETSDSRTAGD